MQKKLLFLGYYLFWFSIPMLFAQSKANFYKQYEAGKLALRNAQYSSAQTIFGALLNPHKNNLFIEHAHYFYALAAFKNNQKDDALNKIQTLLAKYPAWKNSNDAHYLAANLYFETNAATKALEEISIIADPALKGSADTLIAYYTAQYDLNTLKSLYKEFPNLLMLQQVLVDELAANAENWADVVMMNEILANNTNLQTPEKQKIVRKVSYKDSYNIAIMMPFNMDNLTSGKDLTATTRLSRDMYQGLRLAQMHLAEENIKVRIYAYDIQQGDANKIEQAIQSGELDKIDLFVGPVYDNQFAILSRFAANQKVNIVQPLTDNSTNLQNEFTYLYKPSIEMQGTQVAQYATSAYNGKNMIILYDNLEKNIRFANACKKGIEAKGQKTFAFEQITTATLDKLRTLLEKNMSNSVFIIISSSQLIAEETYKIVEANSQKVTMMIPDSWLNFQNIDSEWFESQEAILWSPDYSEPNEESYTKVKNDYKTRLKNNYEPSNYSYIGYDIAYYFAKILSQWGTNTSFKGYFATQNQAQAGKATYGFDYRQGNDNQMMPILKYKNGRLTIINIP